MEADDGEGRRIACVQFSSRLNDLLQRVNVSIGIAAWTVVVILISFRKEWKRSKECRVPTGRIKFVR